MKSVVIRVEGFLRTAAGAMDPIGRQIYDALVTNWRVLLVADRNAEEVDHWLSVHGFSGHTRLCVAPAWIGDSVLKQYLRFLSGIRHGFGADLVIEPDPEYAAEEIRAGYNVLLYASPEYMLDIWHPDHDPEPRPWDSIVAEIDRQATAKAKDNRLKSLDD